MNAHIIDGKRVYGKTWGKIKDIRQENPNRCIEAIWHKEYGCGYQCQRKRGYGKDGLYCKQHSKMRGEQG